MSDPLYTTPCPFDETERCYQINAEGCRNACGVIREKAATTADRTKAKTAHEGQIQN